MRYADLVAQGKVRLKAATSADVSRLPQYEVPEDLSPLDVLLAMREEDDW